MPAALRQRALWIDLGICLLILIPALYLRADRLIDFPAFTDETEDIRRALLVARGRLTPMTNWTSYVGPWNNYVAAAAFRIFGFDFAVARAVTLALALGTIGLVYALVRALGRGRLAATLAAALLAASGAHVLVGSRVAWSHCTSPFYTTLAALLVVIGLKRSRLSWFLPAGLACGIALQTHPTTVIVTIGLAVFAGCSVPRASLGRAAAFGVIGFLVGYSPMIVYNLATGLDSLRSGIGYSAQLHGGPLTLATHWRNTISLLNGLAQVVSGTLDDRPESLRLPAALIAIGLSLFGAVWSLRRRFWLVPMNLALVVLLLPLLNGQYNIQLNSRYLLMLLPFLVVGQALLLSDLLRWGMRGTQSGIRAGKLFRPRSLAGAMAFVLAIAVPLWIGFAQASTLLDADARAPQYNRRIRDYAAILIAQRRAGEPIVFDQNRAPTGVWLVNRATSAMIDLAGVRYVLFDSGNTDLGRLLARFPDRTGLLVTTSVRTLPPSWTAEPVFGNCSASAPPSDPCVVRVRVPSSP